MSTADFLPELPSQPDQGSEADTFGTLFGDDALFADPPVSVPASSVATVEVEPQFGGPRDDPQQAPDSGLGWANPSEPTPNIDTGELPHDDAWCHVHEVEDDGFFDLEAVVRRPHWQIQWTNQSGGLATFDKPFNPHGSDFQTITWALWMHHMPPQPLADLPKFYGAGVYALYYTGDDDPYTLLGQANRDPSHPCAVPIYLGKAIPKGKDGKKIRGKHAKKLAASRTTALHGRLNDHRKSIEAATNLNIDDFQCRWLIVDHHVIGTGEELLIEHHEPVWNNHVRGFGNHTPGTTRNEGALSLWDVLHPGRDRENPARSSDDSHEQVNLQAKVRGYLRHHLST